MRPGLRKSDRNPQRSRSLNDRLGARRATTAKHDELVLEHEILSDHGSHSTAATQLRARDSEVEPGEPGVLHA